jgi:hypothetical protein
MLNLATGELGVLSRCLQVCLAFLGQNLRCYLSWVLALLLFIASALWLSWAKISGTSTSEWALHPS